MCRLGSNNKSIRSFQTNLKAESSKLLLHMLAINLVSIFHLEDHHFQPPEFLSFFKISRIHDDMKMAVKGFLKNVHRYHYQHCFYSGGSGGGNRGGRRIYTVDCCLLFSIIISLVCCYCHPHVCLFAFLLSQRF